MKKVVLEEREFYQEIIKDKEVYTAISPMNFYERQGGKYTIETLDGQKICFQRDRSNRLRQDIRNGRNQILGERKSQIPRRRETTIIERANDNQRVDTTLDSNTRRSEEIHRDRETKNNDES